MVQIKSNDILPRIVFSMEEPFTYLDILNKLKEETSLFLEQQKGVNVNELLAGVYLNRLVGLNILKHTGYHFWFIKEFQP